MANEKEPEPGFIKHVKISKLLLYIFLVSTIMFVLAFSIAYSISDFLVIFGLSYLFIGPAYIANAAMVFTSNGKPIDGGKNFIDGKRLFGQTKTWGGFVGGVFFGSIAALGFDLILYFNYPSIAAFAQTQTVFLRYIKLDFLKAYLYPPAYYIPFRAFFCGLGSPLGDLIKSFFKRRLSIGSGKPFWIADQLDFIVTTILLNLVWFPLDIFIILLLLLMTPAITLTANTIAYQIGKKTEPW
nr:CDP-archaeol synthase [Candidatus Sigynarchaeum springense]MDO8116014.1 CDP-archaeol synthase [Candidatus Sigynarchaeota archaeon]